MNLVFAHSGHWLASLIYAAPVIALVGGLYIQGKIEKRRGGAPQAQRRGLDDDE